MGLCNSRDQESATAREGAFLAANVSKGSIEKQQLTNATTSASINAGGGHSLLFRPTKKIVILPEPTEGYDDDGEAAYALGSPTGTEATDVSDLSITPRSKKSPASSKKKQRPKKNTSFTPLMPVSESCSDAVIPEEEDPEAPSDEEEFHEEMVQEKSTEEEEEPGLLLPQRLPRSKAKPPKIVAPEVVLSLSPDSNDSIHPQHMSQFQRLKLQAKIAAKEKRRKNRMLKLEDRLEDVQGYRKLWNDYEKIKKNAEAIQSSPSHEEVETEEFHDPPGKLVRSNSNSSFDLKASTTWFFDFQNEDLHLEIRTVAGDAVCDEEESKSQANLSLLSASSLEAQRRLYAEKRRERKKKGKTSKTASGQSCASGRSRCSDPGSTPLTKNSSRRQLDYGPVRRRHSGSHLEDGSKLSVTNLEVTFSTPDRKGNGEDNSSVVSDLGDDISCGTGKSNDYGVYRRTRHGRRGADPNAQKLSFAFDRALFTDVNKPRTRPVDPPSSMASQNRLDHASRPRRGSPSLANSLVMKFNDAASPVEKHNASSSKQHSETLRKIREMEAFLSKPQAGEQHEKQSEVGNSAVEHEPQPEKPSSVMTNDIASSTTMGSAQATDVATTFEQHESLGNSLTDSYDLLSSPEDAKFERLFASDDFELQVQAEADYSATKDSRYDEPVIRYDSTGEACAKQANSFEYCTESRQGPFISEQEWREEKVEEGHGSNESSLITDQTVHTTRSKLPPASESTETEPMNQIETSTERRFGVKSENSSELSSRVSASARKKDYGRLDSEDPVIDSRTKNVDSVPMEAMSAASMAAKSCDDPIVKSRLTTKDELSDYGVGCHGETVVSGKAEEVQHRLPFDIPETDAIIEKPTSLHRETNHLHTKDAYVYDEQIDTVCNNTNLQKREPMKCMSGQSTLQESEQNRPTSEEVIAAVSINPVIAAMSTEEFFSIAERSAVERATALASFSDMFKVVDKYGSLVTEGEGADVSTPTQHQTNNSQAASSLLGESNRINHLAALRGSGKESEAEIQGLILAEKVTKQVRDVLSKYRSPEQYAPDDEIGYQDDNAPDDEV